MTTHTKPLAEVTQEAITVLTREIGLANTLRFLNQFSAGQGNYTEERPELFRDVTLRELIQQIREMEAQNSS